VDYDQQFTELIKRCKVLVEGMFPIQGRSYTLSATNFRWRDYGDEIKNDLTSQKKLKLEGRSLYATLMADMTITGKDGKAVQTKASYPLLQIPHITARNSFIIDGTEKQVVNQLRLRPGVYAGFTADNNISVFLNTTASSTLKIMLDRETGVMRLRIGTSSHFPICSILEAVGVPDQTVQDVLGAALYKINKLKSKPQKDIPAILAKLRPYVKRGTVEEDSKLITEFLASKPMDPVVNMVTLGKPINSISSEALLEGVNKAIRLSKNESKEDDTESLAFKSIHSVDDFIPEILAKRIPFVKKTVAYQMERKPDVVFAMPPSMLTSSSDHFFSTSEFTRYSDQNNPVDMMSVGSITTVMGEGGISSSHAVTDDVRTIHPSHLGVLDVLHSPEGPRIGVNSHLSLGAKKVGNTLALDVYDAKTGRRSVKTVAELDSKTTAFPDQYDNLGKGKPRPRTATVKARASNEYKTVNAADVDYIFTSPDDFFSVTTAAVPFLPNNHANRVLMADKHIEQAVQLVNPDIPLVQHRIGDSGYEEAVGAGINRRAPISGVVTKVHKDSIVIKPAKGVSQTVHLYHRYPLNSNTFLDDIPNVKVGDRVTKDQFIADNTFTKNNTLALGKNLLTAYTAYKGQNFEDGIVISEAAAKKLTSAHKYEFEVRKGTNVKIGADIFMAAFPIELKYLRDMKTRYAANGILKPGSVLEYGDIIIPAFQKVELHPEFDFSRLNKTFGERNMDISQRWDKAEPGIVQDVVNTRDGVKVVVYVEEVMQIGDKVSLRHGGKGIVVNILPDDQMYKDEHGNVVDVLYNPASVIGRVNTGQLLEAAAGKIAEKTGKTFYADNFNSRESSTLAHIQKKLADVGVKDAENLTDPSTGHVLKDVLVGPVHFYKLKHQVDKKFSARGASGEAYTLDDKPSKGSDSSAQSIGVLDTFSLLSGGATHFLTDVFGVKAQKNDEYWRALQMGVSVPPPKTPFITERFVSMLLGAGINLRQQGTRIVAAPMTDKDVLDMSHGEIDQPTVVKSSTLMPEKGGLFDSTKTGGIGGNRFNHITLADPIPNPLMREAIVSVGKLKTAAEFDEIVAGRLAVTKDGRTTKNISEGATGGPGILNLLGALNLDTEIATTIAQSKLLKGPALDKIHTRMRYLQSLKALKLTPADAYVNKYIPIIPAKFRSVHPLDDGTLNVAQANHGYREIILINNQLKELKDRHVSEPNLAGIRKGLYDAVSGLSGLTPALTRSRDFSGFIDQIKGKTNPKSGLFQSKVQSRTQDLSARSTVIPDPKLGIDAIALPIEMGLTIYKPFIVKRLVGAGHTPLAARTMVEERHALALKMMELEAAERPVIMTRAPSLHKFNLMAFKPVFTNGKAVEVNPLIVGGYNMDFDGDTAGIHVPVSEAARREALEKMLPSRNLFSPREERIVHGPSKETLYGIYLMTTPTGPAKLSFPTPQDAVKAYRDKKIAVNTAILIGNKTHCAGQFIFDAVIPDALKTGGISVTAKTLDALLYKAAVSLKPDQAAEVINKVKDLGNHFVTEVGFSVSLKDLEFDYKKRDDIFDRAAVRAKTVGFSQAYEQEAEGELKKLLANTLNNRFVDVGVTSGALGSKAATLKQMIAAPIAVQDHTGTIIPVPIRKSYAEGHDLGAYLATAPGARKGLIDKGLSVADTGYFNRRVVNSTIEYTISETDCKTTKGIELPIDSQELHDRYGAEGKYHNVLLVPELCRRLQAGGMIKILVRSPLTCKSLKGVCTYCFGRMEDGSVPKIGYHIGALAGQALGERATQLTLRAFHTGGAAGSSTLGFDRIKQIMELPENMRNKMQLAMRSGQVTKIEKAPAGGNYVYIEGERHFIPNEAGLNVTLGQTVKAGDKISKNGVLKPQELLEATGDIGLVRERMINEMDAAYKAAGQRIKRKLYETTVRPLTDRAKVYDAGDAAAMFNVHPGDILSVNLIDGYNTTLQQRGKKNLIKYEPMLISINKLPYYSDDFVGALVHERLKSTLKKAPVVGMSTDLATGHPMAQLAMTGFRHVDSVKGPRPARR
jgi:DNA-directed RNA polymerase subunit beta'